MMIINRAIARRSARLPAMTAVTLLLTPLCACATGSSASFTQAPLLFAEEAAPSDAPVSASSSVSVPAQLAVANGPAMPSPVYLAVGGNAILPVSTVSALVADTGNALAQVTSQLPALTNLQAATLGVNTDLAKGPVTASLQLGALAGVDAQVTGSGTAIGVPDIATAIAPQSGVTAVASPVTGLVSKALVITQPVLSGATAQPVAPSGSSLLTVSAGNLVRICLLKGCR